MTENEVILSLNTLSAIGSPDDWKLATVIENVREMFRLFGLEKRSDKTVMRCNPYELQI